jgi:hypothetical protein
MIQIAMSSLRDRSASTLSAPATRVVVVLLVAGSVGSLAERTVAGIVFDESVHGDLSDDRFAPTLLTLGSGANSLSGTFGLSPFPDMPDLDYVTVTVPEGFVLDQLLVDDAYVGGAFSFLGVQAGPMVTIPWDWSSVESPLLGWTHFGSASVGLDVLQDMGNAPGAIGFNGPLGAGTYAFWIMELNTSEPYSYAFDMRVSSVPGPGPLALVSLAILLGGRRLRRRRRLYVFIHPNAADGPELSHR